MPARITVRALLVSRDIQTIDTLCDLMGQVTMHVEVCSDASAAARKLCHSKFDGIIVDFNERAAALELLKKPRGMTSHRSVVLIAVLNESEEMPSAFRAGASFVLVRPLLSSIVLRTLRAAYPLMVRESRRSFRCPLEIPVYLASASHAETMATSHNISEGGMALRNAPLWGVGERIALRMTLPGADAMTQISAEVCWSDNAGRLGLQFVRVPTSAKEHLISWLSSRLEESLVEEPVLRS